MFYLCHFIRLATTKAIILHHRYYKITYETDWKSHTNYHADVIISCDYNQEHIEHVTPIADSKFITKPNNQVDMNML